MERKGPEVAISSSVRMRTVVGEPQLVANALMTAQQAGRLVSCGQAHQLPDGRISVRARLIEPRPPARRRLLLAGVLVAALGLGGVAWLVVLAVAWVVAHIMVILAGAGVLALVGGMAATKCPGLHCFGCRH